MLAHFGTSDGAAATGEGKAEGAQRSSGQPKSEGTTHKRIAILIVAYNAAGTLRNVLDRIPKSVWERVEEVMVFDDSSRDDTYLVGMGYKAHHGQSKLSVFRNDVNLGYGGNQIRGYMHAIDKGYDIVALIHGDGQYAPEALPELLKPLEAGEADAVFGSRMLKPGGALAGGMPLYKFVGNKILTSFENAALGMSLSEFHSGYRLYSCAALKKIPFHKNTHDFHFDTQIIIQMHAAGLRIVEVPIPTYYGDEICHVNGMKYAKDVVRSVIQYEMHELGLQTRPEYEVEPQYTLKKSALSSHAQLVNLVGPAPRNVLDVGCGQGELAHTLRMRGHHVVGLDARPPMFELDEFIQADLSKGIAIDSERRFDVVILADVLEHMPEPLELLTQATKLLAPGGSLLVSLPNTVHWSVRMQVARGKFDYTNKGILDRGHLRLFTHASALRLFADANLRVVSKHSTPVPWENVIPAALGDFVRDKLEKSDHFFGQLAPNMFAYQHIFELTLKS
ncbi:MAG TPA: bifunctional glycosyltransferase/class I SAM-dependent methyltransferase [Polyangiales bacterium]|jgi:2-polyprenyl-3-methyl-5-hydroxy-6-metoxy-1,4-benzoquinol methylase|nr:bifunctional glycosyltransferase/class I SAM-dependent methyltransferase [Polyangiales bacterium]